MRTKPSRLRAGGQPVFANGAQGEKFIIELTKRGGLTAGEMEKVRIATATRMMKELH